MPSQAVAPLADFPASLSKKAVGKWVAGYKSACNCPASGGGGGCSYSFHHGHIFRELSGLVDGDESRNDNSWWVQKWCYMLIIPPWGVVWYCEALLDVVGCHQMLLEMLLDASWMLLDTVGDAAGHIGCCWML